MNYFRRTLKFCASLTLVSTLCLGYFATSAKADLQMDFSAENGFSLLSSGIPIVNNAMMDVFENQPGVRINLFSQTNLSEIKREGELLTATGENADFSGKLTLTQMDANTINYHFHGVLKKTLDANATAYLSLAPGLFNANILAGRSFRATLKGDEMISGTVPSWPTEDGLWPIAENFRSLKIDSRLGLLKITLSPASSTMLFADARRRQFSWASNAPVFYSGMSQATPTNVPVDFEFQLQLIPIAPQPHAAKKITVTSRPSRDVVQTSSSPQIVPNPRSAEISSRQYYEITRSSLWSVVLPRGDDRPLLAMKNIFQYEFGVSLQKPQVILKKTSLYQINIGKFASGTVLPSDSEWTKSEEGYQLKIDVNGIHIQSSSAKGLFYGVQTLAQLLTTNVRGVARCPYSTVEDWPSLQFRGAQWFPSGNGYELDKKLIRVMARMKMNAAVLQVDFARFDSHPTMAAPIAVNTQQLKELVTLCRENYIEPIPLINCLGHANWAFGNGANQQLMEWPDNRREISANNPKTISFLEDIFKETIDIFHPKYFHIGHDEVAAGPNPGKSYNIPGQTKEQWIMQSVNRWHNWFKTKGIQTMMWGDMLLAPNEANDYTHAPNAVVSAELRQMLPKDVIICDWHYHAASTYPSFQVLGKAGLTVIGCAWYDEGNIATLAQDIIQTKSKGTLQTTWCGFYPDEDTLTESPLDFPVFVLAADYAWSGRKDKPDELSYNFWDVWYRSYQVQDQHVFSSALLSLPGDIADNSDSEDNLQLKPFFAQGKTSVFGNVPFDLASKQSIVLAPDGSNLAPLYAFSSLSVHINSQKAKQIVLLNGALWKEIAGQKIATITLHYKDNSKSTLNLNCGGYALPLLGNMSSAKAIAIFYDQHTDYNNAHLTLARINNPYPEKEITELQFDAISPQNAYVLAGITLLK